MKTTSKSTYDKSTEWLLHEWPWSQVIFTNLLGKKMQSHIYDFKGRFWNRKVQPSRRGSQNPCDLYVITLDQESQLSAEIFEEYSILYDS